jgi:hypothetical protein
MGNRSFSDFEPNPLQEETEKRVHKMKKAEHQLDQLDNAVKTIFMHDKKLTATI